MTIRCHAPSGHRGKSGSALVTRSAVIMGSEERCLRKARGEGVIDVMRTERKHVKKPKGAPAGRVSVSEIRNIAVRMDKARVDRLYQAAPDH